MAKKSGFTLSFFIACLVVLLGLAVLIFSIVDKFTVSGNMKDLTEWYETSGEYGVIYLNNQIQKDDKESNILGIYKNGHAYLPLDWVSEYINDRYYYAEDYAQVFYTLPTETLRKSSYDFYEGDATYLTMIEDAPYIILDFVEDYSDIKSEVYNDGVNRFYIYNDWAETKVAKTRFKEAIRVRGGANSDILTYTKRGEKLTILDEMDKWTKVKTTSGYIGYMRNWKIGNKKTETLTSTFQEQNYAHKSFDGNVILAWHHILAYSANNNLETALKDVENVNVLAPTWYSLTDNKGGVRDLSSRKYVTIAHKHNMQVWATIDNFNAKNIDEKEFLSSTDARASVIAKIINSAKAAGIDGLNLDFEAIPTSAGTDYVQFVREFGTACRVAGLYSSVDSYVPFSYNGHYDTEEQANFCDYVIIMCYDEHYETSEPGSVASIGYTKAGMERTRGIVPREQLIIGVPFYTRVYVTTGNNKPKVSTFGCSDFETYLKSAKGKGYNFTWDEECGQYMGLKIQGKTKYEVWKEDETSLTLKIDAIREEGCAGCACWKLTQECDGFWDVIAKVAR